MLIIAVILGFLAVILCVLFFYVIDSIFGGEDFTTSDAAIKVVAAIIRQNHLEHGVLYDLGSARGNFVFTISRECPGLKVYGIDDSWFRTNFARIRSRFHSGHPIFIKQDIFAVDISKADVVFMFLDKALMPRLEKKLFSELKPGSLAITNTTTGVSHFASWPPSSVQIIDKDRPQLGKLFVYAKN